MKVGGYLGIGHGVARSVVAVGAALIIPSRRISTPKKIIKSGASTPTIIKAKTQIRTYYLGVVITRRGIGTAVSDPIYWQTIDAAIWIVVVA